MDMTEPGITTLTLLCNDKLFDYRSQLAEQTAELERMQQRWLLLEASFDHIQSDSDASNTLQPMFKHSPPDTPTP